MSSSRCDVASRKKSSSNENSSHKATKRHKALKTKEPEIEDNLQQPAGIDLNEIKSHFETSISDELLRKQILTLQKPFKSFKIQGPIKK